MMVVPFDLSAPPSGTEVSSPDDQADFVEISFSADGTTWTSLRKYEFAVWRREQIELPIDDPDEIARLQVSIKAVTHDAAAPMAYLDGMTLEVQYESETSSVFDPIVDALNPPPAAPAAPAEHEVKIYDVRALHSCDIRPFSRTVMPGEDVDFSLVLHKSDKAGLYTTELGELPPGVHGFIGAAVSSSSDPVLHIQTDPEAALGSFSLMVLYKEAQPDGSLLPNYCQYNVVISNGALR